MTCSFTVHRSSLTVYRAGKISKRKTPVSCVGVMNYGGCEQTVKELLPLVDEARANYTRLVQKVAEFLVASGLCSAAGEVAPGADTSKANPLVAEFISKAVAELTQGTQSDVVEAGGAPLAGAGALDDGEPDEEAAAADEGAEREAHEEAAKRDGECAQSARATHNGVSDASSETMTVTVAAAAAETQLEAKKETTTKPKLKLTLKPLASLEDAAAAAARAKLKAPALPLANMLNKQQQQSSRNAAVLSAVARAVLPDAVPVAVAEADDPDAIISALIGGEAPAVVPPSSRVPAGFGSLPF